MNLNENINAVAIDVYVGHDVFKFVCAILYIKLVPINGELINEFQRLIQKEKS